LSIPRFAEVAVLVDLTFVELCQTCLRVGDVTVHRLATLRK